MVRVAWCACLFWFSVVFAEVPGARQNISEYLSSASTIRTLNNALIRLRSQQQIALQTVASLNLRFEMVQKLFGAKAISEQEYETRKRDKEVAQWNSEILQSRILQAEAALRLNKYNVEVAAGEEDLDGDRLQLLYEAQWSTECRVFRGELGLATSELALARFRKDTTAKLNLKAAASKEEVLEADLDYQNGVTAVEQANRLVKACEKPITHKVSKLRG
jgi:hypothetical protein